MADQSNDEGNQFVKDNKLQEAEAAYTKAIELDPTVPKFWSNRSMVRCMLKDRVGALADANKCIEVDPTWDKGYSRKANALQLSYKGDEDVNREVISTCQAGLAVASLENPALRSSLLLSQRELNKVVLEKLAGQYWGTASQEQGGYEQELVFQGGPARDQLIIRVLDRELTARVEIDASCSPMRMWITMPGPNPTLPHIFRFTDQGIDLCGPHLTTDCPTEFSGPGLLTLQKGEMPRVQEDPELQRLPMDQRIVQFLLESAQLIPQDMTPPLLTDPPEEQLRKQLLDVRLQKGNHDLQARYGMEVVEAAMRLLCGVPVQSAKVRVSPAMLAAAKTLKDQMLSAGMLDEASLETQRDLLLQQDTALPITQASQQAGDQQAAPQTTQQQQQQTPSPQSDPAIATAGATPPAPGARAGPPSAATPPSAASPAVEKAPAAGVPLAVIGGLAVVGVLVGFAIFAYLKAGSAPKAPAPAPVKAVAPPPQAPQPPAHPAKKGFW